MFGWQPLCSIITLEEKQMHSSACWEGRCLNCSLGKGVRRDKTQLSSRRLWTWVTSQCRFPPPPPQRPKRTWGVPKRRHFIGSASAPVFSNDVSNFISLFLVMSHATSRIPVRPHLFHKERSSRRLYSALLVPCCQVSVWVSEATVGGGGSRPLSTNACGCRVNSLEFTPDCVREAMRARSSAVECIHDNNTNPTKWLRLCTDCKLSLLTEAYIEMWLLWDWSCCLGETLQTSGVSHNRGEK